MMWLHGYPKDPEPSLVSHTYTPSLYLDSKHFRHVFNAPLLGHTFKESYFKEGKNSWLLREALNNDLILV